ncbi:unnamed protein product [Ceratitis capitata]|uniref:(Mediterranean fruit fly) hypothetical protein n=2 Tax=Ceratitis capitata TaxID=7213 RepID=A0A811UWY0_CERCA|nr:unnamed protein product [Ceratitis capitata]
MPKANRRKREAPSHMSERSGSSSMDEASDEDSSDGMKSPPPKECKKSDAMPKPKRTETTGAKKKSKEKAKASPAKADSIINKGKEEKRMITVDEGKTASLGKAPKLTNVKPPKDFNFSGAGTSHIKTLMSIGTKFTAAILGGDLSKDAQGSLMRVHAEYQELLMSIVAENSNLRGQIEGLQKRPTVSAPAAPVRLAVPTVQRPPLKTAAPTLPKPVETWACIAKSACPGASSEEVVKKVVNEVRHKLGVRIHEIKPTRNGGAIIRTPTALEREKVLKSTRFKEVGLNVTFSQKSGTRVVVQAVDKQIEPQEFMNELLNKNFDGDKLECPRDIRMITKGWKTETDGTINVILEGEDKYMSALLERGRCYVKWLSYKVRPEKLSPACFRCLGFDHRVAECKATKDVCRRCGKDGHKAKSCKNAVNCRNCEFRHQDPNHFMMSAECPIYSRVVARALARH